MDVSFGPVAFAYTWELVVCFASLVLFASYLLPSDLKERGSSSGEMQEGLLQLCLTTTFSLCGDISLFPNPVFLLSPILTCDTGPPDRTQQCSLEVDYVLLLGLDLVLEFMNGIIEGVNFLLHLFKSALPLPLLFARVLSSHNTLRSLIPTLPTNVQRSCSMCQPFEELTVLHLPVLFPTSQVSPVIDSPGHAVPLTPTASSGDPKVMHVSREAYMLEHSRSLERLLDTAAYDTQQRLSPVVETTTVEPSSLRLYQAKDESCCLWSHLLSPTDQCLASSAKFPNPAMRFHQPLPCGTSAVEPGGHCLQMRHDREGRPEPVDSIGCGSP